MGESNNGIIPRALRRIYTIVGAVLGVVILLVKVFTQFIPQEYFLQAVLGAVILFLAGIVISAYFEGKKSISLEEHQKKVSDLEDKHQKDLEDKIANIRRQIAEPYPKNKLVDKESLTYADVKYAIKELIEDIGKDIREGGFPSPDIIIGVDRGGGIVGGMLAKYLKCPLTTMSSSEVWTISIDPESSVADGILDFKKRAERYRNRNKILLVDDACRSGGTLRKAYDTLNTLMKEKPGFELKTATILNVVKKGPPKLITPDFFVYKADRSTLNMPWDKEK